MKLVVLGGGGFRVPLVHGALLRGAPLITEFVLHDVSIERLSVMVNVLAAQVDSAARLDSSVRERAPRVSATTSLIEAVEGADFVFSAVRVGGMAGRVADERVALDLGLLGQETTGPGGIAYGLRTLPVATRIAERVRDLAPDAWVINFTNPAGMITEAMSRVLGDRVVGICDSPLGLAARCVRALGMRPASDLGKLTIDYAGLNHLGWLQGLRDANGVDLLPRLLADPVALSSFEEGQLFGVEWLQTLGSIPNEYLHYYYFTREAIASARASEHTRGEYLVAQQHTFYAGLAGVQGERAWRAWDDVRHERNATYLAEARTEGEERHPDDIESGGYEGVALALMRAIALDDPATLILNVPNRGTVPGLPDDAIVEVPCAVTAAGPAPLAVSPLPGAALGLVQQIKAVDRLAIEAAATRDPRRAVEAFALHPLVDSVNVARALLTTYRDRIPTLDAVFQ